jgi:anti-sigma regulatory factor (Ser/Thr protein kinase)/serine/threonine protein phosphatase PrpC
LPGVFGVRWHDTALPLHDMSCKVSRWKFDRFSTKADSNVREKRRDVSRNGKAASCCRTPKKIYETMKTLAPQTIEIAYAAGLGEAKRKAHAIATKIGFDPIACDEIVLAVSELASNLIKHAHGGELVLTPLTKDKEKGMQIESLDNGPGIVNIEEAMADGFSTVGSLGIGLGAVNRLMDEFEIASPRGAGVRIVCRKWVRHYSPTLRPCPLSIAAATRPHLYNDLNGDAFVIHSWAESTLVGVIDGLGHGQFAHRAAQAALQYVEAHFDRPLTEIFRGTGRACRATRGVVMALARFDWGENRMTFASVGNIETRVFNQSSSFHCILRRGIIGVSAPDPVVTEHTWSPDDWMVMHSDGLPTHWDADMIPGLISKPANVMAHEILRALAKPEDDATVLVVRSAKT